MYTYAIHLIILKWTNDVLDQGPAATEEATSFGGKISFGGKKLRQSYEAVARFQLESRAKNHDF